MSNIEIKNMDGVDFVRFLPQGVCSKLFEIKIKDDIIVEMDVVGGCSGNLRGISSILKGMNIHEVAAKFNGIPCGTRPTSCPDQISKAIEAYITEKQHSQINV